MTLYVPFPSGVTPADGRVGPASTTSSPISRIGLTRTEAGRPLFAEESRVTTTAPTPHTKPQIDALHNLQAADPAHASKAEVQTWLMAEINLPRLARTLDQARAVNTKLYAFWLSLEDNKKGVREVVEEFQEWAGQDSSFLAYVEARPGYFKSLDDKPTARATIINKARTLAMSKAFAETKKFPTGPTRGPGTGKTIACIVDVDGAQPSWIGHSGIGNHQQQATVAGMDALLHGVHKVEEWEVGVCAEVDCMKQALTAGTNVKTAQLVCYCYTWNARTSRWTGKTACANCKQWLSKLKKPA